MSGRTTAKLLRARRGDTLVAPEMPDNVVPHPRYGTAIKPSRHELTADDVRHLSKLKRGSFWPESAIPSDRAADRYGTPLVYVDRLCRCRDCFRPFVFYAREHKHWLESLGFHADSEAVRCSDCRRSVRQVKARRVRIDDALRYVRDRPAPLTRDVLSDKALIALTVDLLALAEHGAIKNLDILKRLRRTMFDRSAASANATFAALAKRIDKLVGPSNRSA